MKGKEGADQRRAVVHRGGEQLIDETVFAATQVERVEPGCSEKFGRICATGMGRGEYDRNHLQRRAEHLDGCDLGRRGGDGHVHRLIQAG